MSESAAKLLATFESLPESEQRELLVAMLRQRRELHANTLLDDELIGLAEELFQTVDAEETDDNVAKSR